jgi:hypothetical protein
MLRKMPQSCFVSGHRLQSCRNIGIVPNSSLPKARAQLSGAQEKKRSLRVVAPGAWAEDRADNERIRFCGQLIRVRASTLVVPFRHNASQFLSAEGARTAKRSATKRSNLLICRSDLRSALRPAAARIAGTHLLLARLKSGP